MDLDVFVHSEIDHLAAGDFEDRRFDGELLQCCQNRVAAVGRGGVVRLDGLIDERRCPIQHALDRKLANRDFGKLVFDGAKRGNRLTELLPLDRVARGVADDGASAAAAHGRQLEPPIVEDVERDLVPFADFAEDVFGRDASLLQNQRRRRRPMEPHLVLFLAVADARKRTLDEKCRERPLAVAGHSGENNEEIGETAVRDPHLLAADREAAVGLTRRPGFGTQRVRA